MIAKLIVHESSRLGAIEELWEATTDVEVWPVRTNAAFLGRLCLDEHFRSGNVDTGLIARKIDGLTAVTAPLEDHLSEIAGQLVGGAVNNACAGFRLNREPDVSVRMVDDRGNTHVITTIYPSDDKACDEITHFFLGEARSFRLAAPRGSGAVGAAADGAILSPMPGRIIAVEVAAGASVAKGQKLVTLEAMKMEHSLVAPFDGIVAELNAEAGGQVSEGALLVRIDQDTA
jgi:3-methylcrotonyl-CoA carboxylase alpha subunit